MSAEDFLGAIDLGVSADPAGLFGRIMRGRTTTDFETLSEDPDRRLVFVMGEDGLAKVAAAQGRGRLDVVGYTGDYVDHLLASGHSFLLAAFPLEPAPEPATWSAVARLSEAAYPEVEGMLLPVIDEVASISLEEHEAVGGVTFSEADRAGREHPEFYSAQKLAGSAGEAWQVRAFLYHEVHLTELYAGDGWTRNSEGAKTIQEFLIPTVPLSDVPGLATMRMDV